MMKVRMCTDTDGEWFWQISDGRRLIASSDVEYNTKEKCWNALRKILNVKKLEIETLGEMR